MDISTQSSIETMYYKNKRKGLCNSGFIKNKVKINGIVEQKY